MLGIGYENFDKNYSLIYRGDVMNKMKNLTIICLVIILSFVLSSCRSIRGKMTVFHKLDLTNKYSFSLGEKEDYTKKSKELYINEVFVENINSLQHQSFEDLMVQQLSKHNFVLDNQNPDYTVLFSYLVDTGKQEQTTNYYYGYGTKLETSTTYTRRLKMIIFDNKSDRNIYETEIRSEGSTALIQTVAPYLIQAIFVDFPRNSGGTYKVSVPYP